MEQINHLPRPKLQTRLSDPCVPQQTPLVLKPSQISYIKAERSKYQDLDEPQISEEDQENQCMPLPQYKLKGGIEKINQRISIDNLYRQSTKCRSSAVKVILN